MSGYYVPSSFSANYVANKKNADGTYTYDSAINRVGIDTQRNLQQLNKQYNVTINNAYAQQLMANRGLRASALGTGYKQAYVQQLQASLNQEVEQVSLSVAETKQNIFNNLTQNLNQVAAAQQQEIDNMRRMASSLEQYNTYLQGLTTLEGNTYTTDFGFREGSFEENYDKLFDQEINNSGILSKYVDENNNVGLSFEDWLRQRSGTSSQDTSWLDWVYNGGYTQYRDFVTDKINSLKTKSAQESALAKRAALAKPMPSSKTTKLTTQELIQLALKANAGSAS